MANSSICFREMMCIVCGWNMHGRNAPYQHSGKLAMYCSSACKRRFESSTVHPEEIRYYIEKCRKKHLEELAEDSQISVNLQINCEDAAEEAAVETGTSTGIPKLKLWLSMDGWRTLELALQGEFQEAQLETPEGLTLEEETHLSRDSNGIAATKDYSREVSFKLHVHRDENEAAASESAVIEIRVVSKFKWDLAMPVKYKGCSSSSKLDQMVETKTTGNLKLILKENSELSIVGRLKSTTKQMRTGMPDEMEEDDEHVRGHIRLRGLLQNKETGCKSLGEISFECKTGVTTHQLHIQIDEKGKGIIQNLIEKRRGNSKPLADDERSEERILEPFPEETGEPTVEKPDPICQICMDNPKSHMMWPCRHFVCELCLKKLSSETSPQPCPFCRDNFTNAGDMSHIFDDPE